MKIISLVCFLLFINFSFAQDAKVRYPMNNYIYALIDNPIDIITSRDLNEFTITAKGAVIEEKGNNAYSLKSKEAGVAYINIYDKKSKSTQSIPVRVRPFPTPTVHLDRSDSEISTLKTLHISRRLTTENHELGCWDVNDGAAITFDLTVIHQNKVHSFKDQKNKFSKDIKSLFEALKKDDLVVFYNIRFKAGNEKELLLNDLAYKI